MLSRVPDKEFIPPSVLNSTIKLFTAISRQLESLEGLSMDRSDFYTCKVVCYVINQV